MVHITLKRTWKDTSTSIFLASNFQVQKRNLRSSSYKVSSAFLQGTYSQLNGGGMGGLVYFKRRPVVTSANAGSGGVGVFLPTARRGGVQRRFPVRGETGPTRVVPCRATLSLPTILLYVPTHSCRRHPRPRAPLDASTSLHVSLSSCRLWLLFVCHGVVRSS